MKHIFCVFLLVNAAVAAGSNCQQQHERVMALRSEVIMAEYVSNKLSQDRKENLNLAGKLGQPLALSLLATREELPIHQRIGFVQLAASIEYSPANEQFVELLHQITKPISASEYKFQIILNALRSNDNYLFELQKLALKSKQKHHLMAAMFWSTVIIDASDNSMAVVQSRANAKIIKTKIAKPQLDELTIRAELFRCERRLKKS